MKTFLSLLIFSSLEFAQSTPGALGPPFGTGGGTAQAQTVSFPQPWSLAVNQPQVCWTPSVANTAAAPTLAITANGVGLTAKPITKLGTTALVANDIVIGAIACAAYDGTEFQLQNPQTAGGAVATPLIIGWQPDGPLGTNTPTFAANTLYLFGLGSIPNGIATRIVAQYSSSTIHTSFALYSCPAASTCTTPSNFSLVAGSVTTPSVGGGGIIYGVTANWTFSASNAYLLAFSSDSSNVMTDAGGAFSTFVSVSNPVFFPVSINSVNVNWGTPTVPVFPATLSTITQAGSSFGKIWVDITN